ncbi:hypothetical protein ACEYYH_02230 [Microbacterium trichothecenolyticum]|uniref:hypothetical protein n=1 Tax=Microbacterium trichothecenolyticum TaxID=69370 RepID=UPI0035BE5561
MKRAPLAILLTAFLILTPAVSAFADEPAVDPEITNALEQLPGGIAVDPYTAQWPDLGITFSVPNPHARSVGGCSTGLVCAYRHAGQTGAVTKFSGGCGAWSTTAFGDVGSIANARTSGWVYGRNASGTNITFVGYCTAANTPTQTIKSIACGGDGIV